MRNVTDVVRLGLLGAVGIAALVAAGGHADAGGFAIREQSAESQGASFAGNAAGTGLSSMYWNPAAAANKKGGGINTESHYSLIIPDAQVTVDSVSGAALGNAAIAGAFAASPQSSGDIAGAALVPASYASYQLSNNMFLGVSINSGFGLVTEPDNQVYDGAVLARTSKLFTTNIAPTLAYAVSPGIAIGAGVQVQYAKGAFKFATGVPQNLSSHYVGDDVAFGATAGIMLTPAAGTRIGLGWRSALTHTLEGDFFRPTTRLGAGTAYRGEVDVKLPDIVTLSLQQALAPNLRLLGTVEWSNWSRFKELRVKDTRGIAADLVIEADWVDGWFFSAGAEYDYSKSLTLRGGVAFEMSPVDDPKKRIIGIPDSDRIWVSLGASYKWSEHTTLDFAYTHIFLDDAKFDRTALGTNLNIKGSVDASTDIISASLKTKVCILGGC